MRMARVRGMGVTGVLYGAMRVAGIAIPDFSLRLGRSIAAAGGVWTFGAIALLVVQACRILQTQHTFGAPRGAWLPIHQTQEAGHGDSNTVPE